MTRFVCYCYQRAEYRFFVVAEIIRRDASWRDSVGIDYLLRVHESVDAVRIFGQRPGRFSDMEITGQFPAN